MLSKEFQTDSVAVSNAMHNAELARLRGRLISAASGLIVKALNEITGARDCRIIHANTDGLVGDRVFTGTMRIEASVSDHGDRKVINIPVVVEKSVIAKLDQYIIKKKLASIESKSSRHLGEVERLEKNMSALKESEAEVIKAEAELIKDSPIFSKEAKEIEYNKGDVVSLEIEPGVIYTGKVIKDNGDGTLHVKWDDENGEDQGENKDVKKTDIKKEAKVVDLPSGGRGTSDANMQKTMVVDKTSYPNDLVDGDQVNVSGHSWSVKEDVSPDGKSPSMKWVFTLIEGK